MEGEEKVCGVKKNKGRGERENEGKKRKVGREK
jgi:hypothetical protein